MGLVPRPARVLLFATEDAQECHRDRLTAELQEIGVRTDVRTVPTGATPAEIDKIVEALVEAVPAESRVSLDITLGFRHLPLIYFATLAYLGAAKGVALTGIYYGAFEASDRGITPILDLTGLADIMRWLDALGTARATADYREVAKLIGAAVKPLLTGDAPAKQLLSDIGRNLTQFTARSRNGLPVESGIAAGCATRNLEAFLALTNVSSLARRGAASLREDLNRYALSTPGPLAKETLLLDRAELDRQLAIVGGYCERHDVLLASLVLRETIVSAYIFKHGDCRNWLEAKNRMGAERALSAASYRLQQGIASEADRRWGDLLQEVGSARNAYAHAGMRPMRVEPENPGDVARVRNAATKLWEVIDSQDIGPVGGIGVGRIAIVPLGLSPGVVYTLLCGAWIHGEAPRPDALLCVCSENSRRLLDEAIDRSGSPRPSVVEPIVLRDPYAGVGEIEAHLKGDRLRSYTGVCAQYEEIVVCETGGTTLMGFLVERLAQACERLGLRVRRIAVIDKRSPEEQRAAPYVAGEIHDLPNEL